MRNYTTSKSQLKERGGEQRKKLTRKIDVPILIMALAINQESHWDEAPEILATKQGAQESEIRHG